jgi:hypothetical protein
LRLKAENEMAAQFRAKGYSDKNIHERLQRESKLSAADASLIKEIGLSCLNTYATRGESKKAEVTAIRDRASIRELSPDDKKSLEELNREGLALRNSCIDDLRRTLGAAKFQKLHQYLKASFAPQVHLSDGSDSVSLQGGLPSKGAPNGGKQ